MHGDSPQQQAEAGQSRQIRRSDQSLPQVASREVGNVISSWAWAGWGLSDQLFQTSDVGAASLRQEGMKRFRGCVIAAQSLASKTRARFEGKGFRGASWQEDY